MFYTLVFYCTAASVPGNHGYNVAANTTATGLDNHIGLEEPPIGLIRCDCNYEDCGKDYCITAKKVSSTVI